MQGKYHAVSNSSNKYSASLGGKTYYNLNGQFQEFRYYSTPLSESVFNDFVLNPYSIESNEITGSQSSHESL